MKKLLLIAAFSLLAGTLAFAGGESEEGTGFSGDYAFGGSTTVDPIITAAIEEWRSIHPDVHISYEGVGSSNGIKGVMSGQYSLGAASRAPKSSETGVIAIHVALDAIAPVVNKNSVAITNIKLEDLAKIYAGEITNWKDVDGPDSEIVVFNRDDASGTYETFEKLVMGAADLEFMDEAGVVTSNGDMAAKVGATPYAIGYVGLGFVEETGLRQLSINGITGSVDSVYSKEYAVWRYLNVVYYEDTGLGEVELEFVKYLLSDEGQQIVEEEAYISLPEDVVAEMLSSAKSAAQ